MFSGSRERVRLLLRVSRRYYLDGADQRTIGSEVGYSRATVSRLLAEARERGIIRFSISHPLEQTLELEALLMRRFGLAAAVVADGASGSRAVGPLAARTVAERLASHTLISLAHGAAVSAVVEAMPRLEQRSCCVTPMTGALFHVERPGADSSALCRAFAGRISGVHRTISAPMVLPDPAAARCARGAPEVVAALELAARADLAILGVGSMHRHANAPHLLQNHVKTGIDEEARRGGAVARLLGHYLDAKGRQVPTSLRSRLVGLDLERLAGIGTTMVIAWGEAKAPALHAALRSGLLSAIVTDEPTARAILATRMAPPA